MSKNHGSHTDAKAVTATTPESTASRMDPGSALATQEPGGAVAIPQAPKSVAIIQPTNTAALARVSKAQVALGIKLAEIEEMLSLPFVSPKRIAEAGWLFTLVKHGETEFPKKDDRGNEMVDKETGEVVMEPVHLWLGVAQEDMLYQKNDGENVDVKTGDRFVISQKLNRTRDRIADEVMKIIDEEQSEVVNVTMRFAKQSAKGKAMGWGRAIGFAVADFSAS
jgi:hypothetical protein